MAGGETVGLETVGLETAGVDTAARVWMSRIAALGIANGAGSGEPSIDIDSGPALLLRNAAACAGTRAYSAARARSVSAELSR